MRSVYHPKVIHQPLTVRVHTFSEIKIKVAREVVFNLLFMISKLDMHNRPVKCKKHSEIKL